MTDAQIRTLDDSQAAQVQHLREIADKIERGEIAVRMCRDEPTDRHYDHIRRLALDYILVDSQRSSRMVKLEQPRVPLETPQPSLVRLPRHPGPGGRPVKCKAKRGEGECGQVLGISDGTYLFVRHGGREMVSGLPCNVRCDRCGGWQVIQE